jgi:hypothetical protein
MVGTGAQGLVLVKTGVEALQKALVGLPMGSELHTAVLKAITDITRRMQNAPDDHSAQIQQMGAMARDMQNNPQAAALQRLAGGGGPPPGGAPPGPA